jgi:hypothetical protein
VSARDGALDALAALLELPQRLDALEAKLSVVLARLEASGGAASGAAYGDVAEAARIADVAEVTIRRWVRTGEVRAIRRGRVVRVDLASLRGRAVTEQAVTDAAFAARAGTRRRAPDCASDRGERP